jgi:hypothetical protein
MNMRKSREFRSGSRLFACRSFSAARGERQAGSDFTLAVWLSRLRYWPHHSARRTLAIAKARSAHSVKTEVATAASTPKQIDKASPVVSNDSPIARKQLTKAIHERDAAPEHG